MILFTKAAIRYSFLIMAMLTLIAGCNPALKITGMDISSLYTGQKENSLRINQLYHINDSLSTLSIILPAGLIAPEPGSNKYTKKGTLKYEIIGEGKRIELIDSSTFAIADTSDKQSFLSHTWTFRALPGMSYFVKATYSVPDLQDDFLLLEEFDKKNRNSQSWYRFQTADGDYLTGNITAYPQPLRLVTADTTLHEISVQLFSRKFAPPIPPFAEKYREPFDYKPDSTFHLRLENGKSSFFSPVNTGFYFFQTDTSAIQGPSLFRMTSGFPKVTMHSLMRESLRYITSGKEFQLLNTYADPKVAVDSFWITNAGRSDLATELIRKYYQRVETANRLFTSFTDGWKTDRGMVYIVMGKPARVFRGFGQEVWIFGDYDDPRALKFYFNKALNPFTNNDYVLTRNEYYKSIWYQNVQVWRR